MTDTDNPLCTGRCYAIANNAVNYALLIIRLSEDFFKMLIFHRDYIYIDNFDIFKHLMTQ